jgi:hypothetical protein
MKSKLFIIFICSIFTYSLIYLFDNKISFFHTNKCDQNILSASPKDKVIRKNSFTIYSSEEDDFISKIVLPKIQEKNNFIKFYFDNLECGNKFVVKTLSYPSISNKINEKSWDNEFDIFWNEFGEKKLNLLFPREKLQ